MRVLVACEESQEVCKAFRELGHEAYSCDIQPCSGGHPEWHIQGDALNLIGGRKATLFRTLEEYHYKFQTMDGREHVLPLTWDLIIAHPPCTYLTVSGNAYFSEEKYGDKAKARKVEREKAADFFMRFINADCDHIAVENPVGCMSTRYRKPDCIIQPFQFGHPYSKTTCLWLKGLPKLQPTNVLQKPDSGWENQQITRDGRYGGYGGKWGCRKDGKWLRYGDPAVKRERSKTFPGVARAMAEQWGRL